MIKNKMYHIKWRDHFSTDGFFDTELSELADLTMELETLGFFVKEDDHYFHFARTSGTDLYADLMSIIKEQVIKIHEVITINEIQCRI